MKTKTKVTFSIILILTASLIGFSSLTPPAAKSFLFRYNLTKGNTYKLLIDSKQTINLEMGGQKVAMNQTVTIDQSVSVMDVDASNNSSLDITYDRIQFKQNAMGMDMNWDSENKDALTNPMAQQLETVFRKTIGARTTLLIDQLGKAISNNVQSVLKDNANISGFESGMMVVFPEQEVKIGETWESTYAPDPNSDLTITSKYTLVGVKKDVATISFEGTIKGTNLKGNATKIEGTMSGKSLVNSTNGWIISSSINQNLNAETEQQGMTIPMKISSYIDITSK